MLLIRKLDTFLNAITMYRLVLYGLYILAAAGLVFSFVGLLNLSAGGMLITFITLVPVCYVTNKIVSHFWGAVVNSESAIITALILGCILPQATSLSRWLAIVMAGVVAMASKYLLTLHNKHIFNPAALAAVVLGIFSVISATWWIGTPVLLPFTVVLGVLVLRKLRRFQLFFSFLLAAVIMTVLVSLLSRQPAGNAVKQLIDSSPLLFLGSIMLTEPLTTPPRSIEQMVYGGLVAIIFAAQFHVGRISSTPELALIIGNVYSYAVSPKYKLILRLKQKIQLSERVYDFIFLADRQLAFLPGQYMEWTLPLPKADGRGNRRSFSIASSPTEKDVHLGVTIGNKPSRFKAALGAMRPGDVIVGGQLSGNFVLPRDESQKLVFIAGGIGITPFRSMLKYIIDNNLQRNIVLFYMVSEATEISYKDVLAKAAEHGLQVVTVLSSDRKPAPASWQGETGHITPELLKKHVPDYIERRFYISGPSAMVNAYTKLLRSMHVGSRSIIKDYFSGY